LPRAASLKPAGDFVEEPPRRTTPASATPIEPNSAIPAAVGIDGPAAFDAFLSAAGKRQHFPAFVLTPERALACLGRAWRRPLSP